MSGLAQSILEDYDHDSEDAFAPLDENGNVVTSEDDADPMNPEGDLEDGEDTLDEDVAEIENIEQSMNRLTDAMHIIESFGVNDTTVALLQTTQLMTSTSLGNMATESLGRCYPRDAATGVALEALGGELLNKAKEWAAKIVSSVANAAAMVGRGIMKVVNGIGAFTKFIAGKTWDGAKAATEVVKAHPYKTIIAVLAAAAAIVAIVVFVPVSIPSVGAAGSAMTTFMSKLQSMYNAIKWPFGKVTTTPVMNGRAIVAKLDTAKDAMVLKAATSQSLGWSYSAVTSVVGQITKSTEGIRKAGTTVWTKVVKPAEKAVSKVAFAPNALGDKVKARTGSKIASWATENLAGKIYYPILFKVGMNLYQMIKAIVLKAFNMVVSTLNAIKRVFI